MAIATWNMQGANHGTENKWNEGIRPLVSQNSLDLICLQEPGAPPPSAQQVPQGNLPFNPDGEVYEWGTSQRSGLYILFRTVPNAAGRCHLGLVSRSLPINDHNIQAQYGNPRPAYGVQFQNRSFYTVHISSGRSDDQARGEINNVDQNVDGQWVAAGDFNRQPQLMIDGNWTVCPPNGTTHNANDNPPQNRYDYALKSWQGQSQGQVETGIHLSDHFPVVYDIDVN